jgi:hypothetical protein
MFQKLSIDESNADNLPEKWQSFYHWQEAATHAMLPPVICLLVGFAAVLINMFYPIPEAVFLVGLVASRVRTDTELNKAHVPQYEMDLRLLDAISAAFQNLKGVYMLVFSVLGMTISAAVFFVGLGLVTTLLQPGNIVGVLSANQVWLTVLIVVIYVMFPLSWLMMGVYSLVHWVRQLERIEPYARQWDDTDGDRVTNDVDEEELVTRPPGLLLPADLPLVGVIMALVISSVTEPGVVFGGILAGCMSVAVLVMGWGFIWTRRHRHDPQSLTHESRNLLVTVLLQFSVFMMLGGMFNFEILKINEEMVLSVALALLFITLTYHNPDFNRWSRSQGRIRMLLGKAFELVLVVLLIALLRVWGVSTLLTNILLIGYMVFIVFLYLLRYIWDASNSVYTRPISIRAINKFIVVVRTSNSRGSAA